MKVATVQYVGRSLHHSRRGPSDERYRFVRTTSGNSDSAVGVESVEDALYFERKGVFEVEWTPLGQLVRQTDGPVTEAESALANIGYRQKQKMAKSLGLKASGSEEELEERLKPEVEELQKVMEEP